MDEVLKDVLPGKIGAQLAFLSRAQLRQGGRRRAADGGGDGVARSAQSPRRRRGCSRAIAFASTPRTTCPAWSSAARSRTSWPSPPASPTGSGLGHNSRAALITRGLAEISRLAVRKAANPLTLAGLAGLGDLVLTCTGDLSRNRTVGIGLGRGQTLREVLAGMSQVAEGVKTTKSAHDLAARLGVEMPITEAMYRVLYEDQPAREAVLGALGRAPKHELA